MPGRAHHRRCILVRGTPADTRARCDGLLGAHHDDDVLWVGDEHARFVCVSPARVRHHLGTAFDAVVLDLHAGIDADVFGQVHGLIWGGGHLVLRLPPAGERPPGDGTHRLWERLERTLARHPAVDRTPAPLTPGLRPDAGTADQAAAVHTLADAWCGPGPSRTVLMADRGRGKSSALGLAVAEARRRRPDLRVVVTADREVSVAEVQRHGGDVRFCAPAALLADAAPWDVLVVDEAARLPVPLLQRLVSRHTGAHLAFATTTRGYEGTGRGFVLRFLQWLEARPVPVQRPTLRTPIRWDPGDPVEALVFEVLALDAEPATVACALDPARVSATNLDRDTLATDEPLLRELFGLLVGAHYRTTPGDLHRLLDARNVRVHALLHEGHVVGATLLALEGALPADTCAAMHEGRFRIRGHALADTLVCHLGRPDAGSLRMVRSVRIATHPELRRQGLAARLVDHVHASYTPDLFGTLFGATPALLGFRRSLGYALVRVGTTRGSRTGEPAAVMLRPASPRAVPLVEELRHQLARDLPLQLRLLATEDELGLPEALTTSLLHALPSPAPWTDVRRREAVRAWADGPRPFEASAGAIRRSLGAVRAELDRLPDGDRDLVVGRVFEGHPWRQLATERGWTVRQTMRAVRRLLRPLLASGS